MLIEVFIPNPESPDFTTANVISMMRDAMIGKIFLTAKAPIDKQYADGYIAACEYAMALAIAAELAHQHVNAVLPLSMAEPDYDPNHEPAAYGEG